MTKELSEQARQIVGQNLALRTRDDLSVIEIDDIQQALIRQFLALGYTSEDFFEASRRIIAGFE